MVARSCAKRAHQLAATLLHKGVGPSRLSTASTCPCHLHTSSSLSSGASRIVATSTSSQSLPSLRATRRFTTSAAAQATNRPNKSSRPRSVELLTEDVSDVEPTLEYLDSLKPRIRWPRKDRRPSRNAVNPFAKPSAEVNPEDKLWERTQARINASFTRDQLALLGRAAKLPGSYSAKVRKDDLVRRIMVHRFGMLDAKERADRERQEELQRRSVRIGFRPAELYLLLARGSDKVRQEASRAHVTILLQSAAENDSAQDQLGFWIRGKDEGIARMSKWIEDFKHSMHTREEELTLFAPSDAPAADASAAQAFPPELVRFILQLSTCFIEAGPLSDGKAKLSLTYLHERDAQKAVLLLRQYQDAAAEATQRIGAVAYRGSDVSGQEYAMLPFTPNEPTSWIKQADDALYGTSSDLSFRVTHVLELNALSIFPVSKLSDMALSGWATQGEMDMSDPFGALYEAASLAASEASEGRQVEYSASLGHLLYSSDALTLADEQVGEDELVAKLQDPLMAPRPGSWPLESFLEWTREFRARFGKEASRFVPATLFRSQKNVSFDIWLERQGYTLAPDAPRVGSEKVVLVYRPAEAGYAAPLNKLELTLARKQDADAGGAWLVETAQWVASAQSDVLVPERSADLRLGARILHPVDEHARTGVEQALTGYLSPPRDRAEETDTRAEAEARPAAASLATDTGALPPLTLQLDGAAWALESATRHTMQQYHYRSSSTMSDASPAAEDSDTASSAETDAEQAGETKPEQAVSQVLLREISQDLVTSTTTESLRLVWRLASSTHALAWQSVVQPISALLDRHDMSIR
ncbi:uncharacterized protein PAN0_001d0256 [Moesziomyces antarcticus]|uniref:Uncharacterized protein n=1 Tax=Pseudozyma antarctica TaxID=84753 RepID=A0A5C3FDX6_PSEA2|nr:uncharacterized protein PAN0_001d0256 [Moesziomyces antarcticus]GAK62059.1 conserved hypothetical protein [Moesziomyces antarcticus]SPO42588.1 uncharacterized protein PSANT_00271 [Moesziomyces antarcticus]